MVTLDVQFTGFFVTTLLRMTGVVFCVILSTSEGSRMGTKGASIHGILRRIRSSE